LCNYLIFICLIQHQRRFIYGQKSYSALASELAKKLPLKSVALTALFWGMSELAKGPSVGNISHPLLTGLKWGNRLAELVQMHESLARMWWCG